MTEKSIFEDHAKKHVYYLQNESNVELDKKTKLILKKIKTNKSINNIIDIGAGDGNFAEKFVGQDQIRLTVTDISKIRIDRIKKNTHNKLYQYLVDDIMHSKLKSNQYDFVNSDMCIEHVPSDKKMLSEIYRVLKKGGYFKISTVLKNRISFWVYYNGKEFLIDPTHKREYNSKSALIKLIKSAGFKIINTNISPLSFCPFKRIPVLDNIKINKPGYFSITVIGKK